MLIHRKLHLVAAFASVLTASLFLVVQPALGRSRPLPFMANRCAPTRCAFASPTST